MMYAFAEFFLIVAGAIVAIKISNNTDKWYVILALMGVVFGAALVKFIADELKNLKDEP